MPLIFMKHPIIPSFKAVISGTKMLIPYCLGVSIFCFLGFKYILMGAILSGVALFQDTGDLWKAVLIILLFGIVLLAAGLIYFLLLTLIYWGFLKILWSEPPKLLSPPKKKDFWIYYMLIVIATIPSVFIRMILALQTTTIEMISQDEISPLDEVEFLLQLSWLWWLTAIKACDWFDYPKRNISNVK